MVHKISILTICIGSLTIPVLKIAVVAVRVYRVEDKEMDGVHAVQRSVAVLETRVPAALTVLEVFVNVQVVSVNA